MPAVAPSFLQRRLPVPLVVLAELALDLRWTWSHAADALWRTIDPLAWDRTQNPWFILQSAPEERLEALARDPSFLSELGRLVADRAAYLAAPPAVELGGTVAYFSLEFGLGAAVPLYAGGLGILAGDYMKTASDLGAPVVGVGILYQEGYFRQTIDAAGNQHEAYPYNDPSTLPIEPAVTAEPTGRGLAFLCRCRAAHFGYGFGALA
jgi:starch phosphorylase